jgi:ATP-dependent exoDNAse (exonuclease V) beta subunit
VTRPGDWQEREKGRDPDCSYIVQAPAGSGKTELLTQRMLGLLARVENPEEVVAITFTRKAAAEMRHRLVSRLKDAAAQPDRPREPHEQVSHEAALAVLKNSEERHWNLLSQPSRLRIRTIDSLCSELARQLPILSGLGGGQQITEDADALYHAAAARTMAAIEDENDDLRADVIRILDRYDNQYDRLVQLLTSMLGHRDQWLSHLLDIQTASGFNRHGLEDSMRFLIEAELDQAREAMPSELLAALPGLLRYALGNAPADEAQLSALLEACGGLACDDLDLPSMADDLPHWITLTRRLLTADGKKWRAGADASAGFPPPSKAKGEEKAIRADWKLQFKELLDSQSDNDSLREQLNIIRTLPGPVYDDDAWHSLESLMRIMLRAAQEWELVMAQSGEADFSEVAMRAIRALGEDGQPSNLALRMDYRVQHLLVDEFQDTSLGQIRLLNRLTAGWSEGDGRTLFLVGDPMQSIYRFRKAEVSLFIQAFEGGLFRHINLQPLQLQVNFRSTRPIVDWVNEAFAVVMPQHSDHVKGAVHYSESTTKPGASGLGGVKIRILPERDDEREAQQVVDIIRAGEATEKIAVLVRSRNHASDILALLDQLKETDCQFRYQAIAFNPLAETPLVRDLVALTIALIQPADRLAWLTTLRAPFSGLDLADLDELAGGDGNGIILDALAGHSQLPVSGRGMQRLDRIAPILLEAVERRGRESVRKLVESAWTRLGGPACVLNESELSDAATYFDLLEKLENESLPIDRDTLDQRMKNLYAEPDALADGRLKVMTIYAAKGLQFDHVILPGLNRDTGSDGGKLLHWFELAVEDSVVMSPMRNTAEKERQNHSGDLIKYISGVEKRRQALENGRLLYVAATRAIHSLYLFAAVKPTAKGEVRAAPGTLLGQLWPAIKARQAPLISTASEQLAEQAEAEAPSGSIFPQLYRRLAADWRLPCAPQAVSQVHPAEQDVQDYIEFRWDGEDARLTGNLVHRLLQLIAEQGLQDWASSGGMKARENWCRQLLVREGVMEDKADSIVGRTAHAIDTCLSSDRGRWLLSDHDDAHCEHALTAVLDGQPRNLVLDRTFVSDGERWIVDYKTSSHSGGDLEGFLDNEAERYREQLLRYKKAFAMTEQRPIRTALYFPLLDRFREV